MKLFLASTFYCVKDLFLSKIKKIDRKYSVGFIENASDPFKSKEWVDLDYQSFDENIFDVHKIDLRKFNKDTFELFISYIDILHVCGGSAIYLLNLLKEKGFDVILKKFIKSGRIIYTGTSAGSMIMASDISFCCDDEDEQEANMIGKCISTEGIGISPFYMMCHASDKDYIPSTQKAMDRLPDNKIPILFLNDNMAIWINNNNVQILKN